MANETKPQPVFETKFYVAMAILAVVSLGLLAYDLHKSGDPTGGVCGLIAACGASLIGYLGDTGVLPGDMHEKLKVWKAAQDK
jgi:hypothetical protein